MSPGIQREHITIRGLPGIFGRRCDFITMLPPKFPERSPPIQVRLVMAAICSLQARPLDDRRASVVQMHEHIIAPCDPNRREITPTMHCLVCGQGMMRVGSGAFLDVLVNCCPVLLPHAHATRLRHWPGSPSAQRQALVATGVSVIRISAAGAGVLRLSARPLSHTEMVSIHVRTRIVP